MTLLKKWGWGGENTTCTLLKTLLNPINPGLFVSYMYTCSVIRINMNIAMLLTVNKYIQLLVL